MAIDISFLEKKVQENTTDDSANLMIDFEKKLEISMKQEGSDEIITSEFTEVTNEKDTDISKSEGVIEDEKGIEEEKYNSSYESEIDDTDILRLKNDYTLFSSMKNANIKTLHIDNEIDIEVSDVFNPRPIEHAKCNVNNKTVSSIDFELTNLHRNVLSVEGFTTLAYRNKKILLSNEIVRKDFLEAIKKAIIEEYSLGRKYVLRLVEEYESNGRSYARTILSYGELTYLLKYFQNCGAEIRTVKKNDMFIEYVLAVGV